MNENGDNNKLRKKNLGKEITGKSKQGFFGFTVVKMETFPPDSSSKDPSFETKEFPITDELKCLMEGEKLLIQQVAAYVPLLHLQNGQIGSRGHVCSFVQDISSICTVLPRLPDDVHFVKVVKSTYKRVVK